jgi:hypothetical protein
MTSKARKRRVVGQTLSASVESGSVGHFLNFVAPTRWREVPSWPPDAFALAAALLYYSGGYRQLVSDWPPRRGSKRASQKDYLDTIDHVSTEWREAWNRGLRGHEYIRLTAGHFPAVKPPAEVVDWWNDVISNENLPVARISEQNSLCHALIQLVAAADEASSGIGVPSPEDDRSGSGTDAFDAAADSILIQRLIDKEPSSLCHVVPPWTVQVLPKQHTPQAGLTLRSLTHHLALRIADEIQPHWTQMYQLDPEMQPTHSLNLLLVPWPSSVVPAQFRAATHPVGEHKSFEYDPRRSVMRDEFRDLFERACAIVERIDGIIFPELSLRHNEAETYFQDALQIASSHTWHSSMFLVAGSGSSGKGRVAGKNYLSYLTSATVGGVMQEIVQSKLHRWRIDASQIRQYGLGSRLDSMSSWWEHITIPDRHLHFFTLRPWLTLSILICEDLARQDSISDLIRSVGPNLVIALLMDGPQLSTRWPARYATVLADDPGSSVLTLTSLGMASLCRPPGAKQSRVVALWKDALSGAPIEIELPDRAAGIILSVTRELHEEFTADYRSDRGQTAYIRLTGIHPVFAGQGVREHRYNH